MFSIGAVAGGLIVGTIARVQWLRLSRVHIDWPDTVGGFNDDAQIVALAVAGWWAYRLFLKQRVDRVRADVMLDAQCVVHDGEKQIVRVLVGIKNVGNVELCPYSATVELSGIARHGSPLSIPTNAKGKRCTADNLVEQWPTLEICHVRLHGKLILEPGEIERIHLTSLFHQMSLSRSLAL